MFVTGHAKLAVAALALVAGAAGELAEPLPVRFELADGVRVTGTMTAWDARGFDGSFGPRRWTELAVEDTWRLYRRVMDESSAVEWVGLGAALLRMPKGNEWAERAFRQAMRLDEAMGPAIEEVRAEAAESARLDEELRRAIEAEKLRTTSPEAEPWGADAWPELSSADSMSAAATMRGDADRYLAAAGMALNPLETEYFIFYSDLPRANMARWAGQLDAMYRRLAAILSLPAGQNLFWGKAVIFVFSERDRFRLMEAAAFNQLVPQSVDGMCHPIGPKVFINFHRYTSDDRGFAAILVHETVHGFMHRYRTPRRLPTWANEGFADYLAAVSFEDSPIDSMRRRKGLDYLRSGQSLDRILGMQYGDGTWPGPDRLGYSVSYLVVRLMVEDRPRKFGDWVNAIKAGKEWIRALEEDYGVTVETLVETCARYYAVND
jgi:hypothetical protein